MSSSDDDEKGAAGAGAPQQSKGIALRLQKKLLGMGVKSKAAAMNLNIIGDREGELLDNVHSLVLLHSGKEKTAKKLQKDLIKMVIKLALLYRHSQFNEAELALGQQLSKKFKMIVLTLISYHDVAYSFDGAFLSGIIVQCKDILQAQIARHLHDKSKGRVDNVFGFFANPDLLDKLYNAPEYKALQEALVAGLSALADEGKL